MDKLNFIFNPNTKMSELVSGLSKLGANTKLIKNMYVIDITQEFKENILSGKKIKSDCRIAAHLIGCLIDNSDEFIMPISYDYVEIIIPKKCLYLTVGEKFRELNIQRALREKQGQWIVEYKPNRYLGLTSDGMIEKSIERKLSKIRL